jgi:3-hydroxyacyl-CoA dehydrogenase
MATRPSKLYDDTTAVRVAIVGAGLMGAQIGCEYAVGGHEVVLHARDAAAARARADAGFALLREHDLRSEAELAEAAGRVCASADAATAAEGAELVVESLPEDPELKTSVLESALTAAPEAIVATNTSSLSIGALGEAIGRPEKTVGTVMREGLARRWRRVGPLRAIALGGIDTWNRSGRNILPEISTATELPDLSGVAITDGDLASDAARRDEALARELREERGWRA